MKSRTLLVSLLVCSASLGLRSEEYDIVMLRTSRVGDISSYQANFVDEQSQKMQVDHKPIRDSQVKTEGSVKARVEVTAINKYGAMQSAKITIEEWSLKLDGKDVESLKAGR